MDNTLTVAEVLEASAEFDHRLEVRSIGPALVFVLEAEGPARMDVLASTDSELRALMAHVRSDPRASLMLDSYLAGREESDHLSFTAEDRHVTRLEEGRQMQTLRVRR